MWKNKIDHPNEKFVIIDNVKHEKAECNYCSWLRTVLYSTRIENVQFIENSMCIIHFIDQSEKEGFIVIEGNPLKLKVIGSVDSFGEVFNVFASDSGFVLLAERGVLYIGGLFKRIYTDKYGFIFSNKLWEKLWVGQIKNNNSTQWGGNK